jgi:hypothetical protein
MPSYDILTLVDDVDLANATFYKLNNSGASSLKTDYPSSTVINIVAALGGGHWRFAKSRDWPGESS